MSSRTTPRSTTTGKSEKQLVRERDQLAARTAVSPPSAAPAGAGAAVDAVREGGGPNSPPVKEKANLDFVAQAKRAAAVTAVDGVPVPPAVADAAAEQILRNNASMASERSHRQHRSSRHDGGEPRKSSSSSRHHTSRHSASGRGGETDDRAGEQSSSGGGGGGIATSGAEGGDEAPQAVQMRNRLRAMREEESAAAAAAAALSVSQLPAQQSEPASPGEGARAERPPTPHGTDGTSSTAGRRQHRSHRDGKDGESRRSRRDADGADSVAGDERRSHRSHRSSRQTKDEAAVTTETSLNNSPQHDFFGDAVPAVANPAPVVAQADAFSPSEDDFRPHAVGAAATVTPVSASAAPLTAAPALRHDTGGDDDSDRVAGAAPAGGYATSDSESIFPSGSGLDPRRAQFLMAQLRGIQAELHATLYDTSSGPEGGGDETDNSRSASAAEFFHQAPYYFKQQQQQQQQHVFAEQRRVAYDSGNERSTTNSMSAEGTDNASTTPMQTREQQQQFLEQQYRFLMGMTPDQQQQGQGASAAFAASAGPAYVSPEPPRHMSAASFSPDRSAIAAKIQPDYFHPPRPVPDYKLQPVGPERRAALLRSQKTALRVAVTDIRRSYQVAEFAGQPALKKDPNAASPLRDAELRRAVSPQRILSERLVAERTLNVAVRERERRHRELLQAMMETDGKNASQLRSLLALHLAA